MPDVFKRVVRADIETAEAAGLLAAVGSVGPSFQPGLLPRTTRDQAVITGVVAAANYGLTVTAQEGITAVARRLSGSRRRAGAATFAANLGAAGAGAVVQRLFAQRPGESLARAAVRAAGWRLITGGVAGALTTGADGLVRRLTGERTVGRVNVWTVLGAGTAVGAGLYFWQRRAVAGQEEQGKADAPSGEHGHGELLGRRAILVGAVISGSITAASRAESAAASIAARGVRWAAPSLAPFSLAAGNMIVRSLVGYAAYRGARLVYHRLEEAGTVIEPAYDTPPSSRWVSGGPGSLVDWADFGREGRRYVNMALTAGEIEEVTGATGTKDPIRVFVGLASAATATERADLAMRELERLGAFDRGVIAYFSPTGTGYVNYMAVETVEYLTGGDVASAAIQYSVRPSYLSLDRIKTAWEDNLAFLTAMSWKLRSMPPERRPRLLLFGESLGSHAAQNVFLRQGARGMDLLMIDRALFVGTPFASAWRRAWLDDPAECDPEGRIVEVASYDEWLALPRERRERTRIVLLTHDEDPIPKLGLPLLIQAPEWLGPPDTRRPGIPRGATWRPFVTSVITFVDLLNANRVVPGRLEALGHDYRADLSRFIHAAFDLPAGPGTLANIDKALGERELAWARRRQLGESLRPAAVSAVRRRAGRPPARLGSPPSSGT
ncbi:alpha/beta-hydrolase family protein [Planobispora takensis]|nr:alpha/beta-hydrolase family protein [Planobispora takensis]